MKIFTWRLKGVDASDLSKSNLNITGNCGVCNREYRFGGVGVRPGDLMSCSLRGRVCC